MKDKSQDIDKHKVNTLMTVPSIGELTARFLIKESFDDMDKIEQAGRDIICKLDSIGYDKGDKIFDELEGIRKESPNVTSEFRCPSCSVIVPTSLDICPECRTRFSSLEEQVFLPGGILLDNPLESLAEYELKIADGLADEEIWYGRAAILESMGEYEAAYDSYDKVIEFDPLYDQIWNAKARLAMKLGKMDEAAMAYKVAVDFRIEGGESMKDMFVDKKPEPPKPPQKEHDIGVHEVENNISKARAKISKLSGKGVNIEHLRQLVREASNARIEDDRENAVKLAKEVIEKASRLKETLTYIDNIKDKLPEFYDDEEVCEEYYNRFQQIMYNIENDEFHETHTLAKKLMLDIEDSLEDIKKLQPQEESIQSETEETVEEHVEIKEEIPKVETQEESIPSETEETVEEHVDEESLDESISEARKSLAEARDTKINIDDIKGYLRDALKARKEDDISKTHDYLEKVLEGSKKVIEIFDLLKEGKAMILKMKDSDLAFKPHLKKLKEIKTLADQGRYEESIVLAEDEIEDMRQTMYTPEEIEFFKTLDKLENRCSDLDDEAMGISIINEKLSKLKELQADGKISEALEKLTNITEMMKDQESLQARFDEVKDRLAEDSGLSDEISEELNFVQELAEEGNFKEAIKKVSKINMPDDVDEEKIKEGINNFKKYIVIARNNDLEVDEAGGIINKAMIAGNNGSYQEALEFLNEGMQHITTEIETKISQDIAHVEELINDAEEGADKDKAKKNIGNAREFLEDEDYRSAFQEVSKALQTAEGAKPPKIKSMDRVKSIEQLIEDCKTIGVDVEEAKELLYQAIEKIEQDSLDDASELTQEAKDRLITNISKDLKILMKEAQKELREAKLSGKNVSKPIYLLKQVKDSEEEEILEKNVRYLLKYKQEMQNMAE